MPKLNYFRQFLRVGNRLTEAIYGSCIAVSFSVDGIYLIPMIEDSIEISNQLISLIEDSGTSNFLSAICRSAIYVPI